MKTKPFLLATAGSTVDGRTVDDQVLREMAESYNPATYGARLNIEHIRGVSGEKPFRAYGDVLELSTGEVEVDFNGRTEKRLGLYGVFDVTGDAKALNDARQKVYPSIEIESNFAGKGYAYLMGVALTDSPAMIATERLKFNRIAPGALALDSDRGMALELAGDEAATAEASGAIKGFFARLTEMLGGSAPAPAPAPAPAIEPQGFDAAALALEMAELGDVLAGVIDRQNAAFRAGFDKLAGEVAALGKAIETTPPPGYRNRPLANGQHGGADYSQIF